MVEEWNTDANFPEPLTFSCFFPFAQRENILADGNFDSLLHIVMMVFEVNSLAD